MPYLSGLRLAGRRVVVVGGGRIAMRRLPRLIESGAQITVISPEVSSAIEGMVRLGEVEWIPRGYRAGDLYGAWYVLAVTDVPKVNQKVAGDAEAARIFCVRADQADGGTAHTPAVARHAGASVGVLGGGDPRRAAGLRDSILRWLRGGKLTDVRHRARTGGVALVGGGPGDPDLITVRGRQLLAEADVVITDRLAPRALLEELAPDAEVIDASKLPRGRFLAQEEINRLLIEHGKAGRAVVRLKGGDSYVFGRGMEEMQACAAAGVDCVLVPGVTSAIGVPASAGIPVTHRGVAHDFTVISGHLPPDDPGSLVDWTAVARLRGTVVMLMAVKHLPAIAAELIRHGRDAETPAAAIQEGTTSRQRTVISTLGKLADDMATADIRPPAIIVIGAVAAFGKAS
ncbi:uroporphyrinogen-III C-methyltransferase [Amycolatopsis sp. MtRt-6]|uniref:uroporphyrinogen-III C-methyltransferase n=1 Tax=Amycolatopsis sp. MtRt-6 TaxID=2792782 RepID=UPI001F5C6296|nr:uroporphyrinogen-III C-methyltransferase [Amycolatopsis sp. MtRt-6]